MERITCQQWFSDLGRHQSPGGLVLTQLAAPIPVVMTEVSDSLVWGDASEFVFLTR